MWLCFKVKPQEWRKPTYFLYRLWRQKRIDFYWFVLVRAFSDNICRFFVTLGQIWTNWSIFSSIYGVNANNSSTSTAAVSNFDVKSTFPPLLLQPFNFMAAHKVPNSHTRKTLSLPIFETPFCLISIQKESKEEKKNSIGFSKTLQRKTAAFSLIFFCNLWPWTKEVAQRARKKWRDSH